MIHLSDSSDFKSSDIPTDSGVYIFRDQQKNILYIGKAANLRSRIRSYFSESCQHIKTKKLVANIRSIDWIIVNNETEALLLENRLIKKHEPKYNISLKDAKTFAYIAFTKEQFPRLLTTRKLSRNLESFGPYTDGFTRQDLQKLVRRVFKLRTCKELPKRACLNFHIDLCTAPCIGNVTENEYQIQVEQARIFLNGDYKHSIEHLTAQMKDAAKQQNYERALELQKQITSVDLLTRKQIVDKERRYDQDVIAFSRHGEKLLAVQLSVRKGVLLGKKEFSVDIQPQIESEFLTAYYRKNQIPHEILLNKRCWSNNKEKAAIESLLSSKRGTNVRLILPRRGDKRALVNLAEKNIESTINETNVLTDVQTILDLPALPRIIECFDVSNLGPEHIVAGLVRFTDGKPDKSNYRRFKIKTVSGQDDFAAINEAVTRRYRRLLDENLSMPDLVIVDGGLGQVTVAQSAINSLGIEIPLVGLAKEHEEIYLPESRIPMCLDVNSKMMLFIRQIRDTAHNFAVRYNRKRRQMKMRDDFKK